MKLRNGRSLPVGETVKRTEPEEDCLIHAQQCSGRQQTLPDALGIDGKSFKATNILILEFSESGRRYINSSDKDKRYRKYELAERKVSASKPAE